MVSEPLDAFTAVFHRPSGITHLLVSPAHEILAAMGEDALTVAALHARLAASFDLDAEPGALAARLDELVEAGLVEIL
nr:HPr-rel-A system PqqD family peptide chaperone [Sphingomonas beigongshangi]